MAELPVVIRPPAVSFDQLKQYVIERFKHVPGFPRGRKGTVDCLEIYGQSGAVRHGFEQLGMAALSFDCRTFLLN